MLTAVRTKRVTPKPFAPQADPRFQNVKAKIGQKAAQIKKHPPAKLKAVEAAKAAEEPKNAIQAGAKEKQTDLMKAANPKPVEPDNFRALLKAEIKKVMPETLDDADNFMEGGKEEEMKGAVSGKVSEQKNTAESQIKTTTTQKPNTAGVKEKEVVKLPPVPPTPVPVVHAAEAMPVPRTEAEISQQPSKRDADQQLKDAQVTTKQLKKADDPRFTAVLTTKSEAEQTADASPAKYRAKEKALIGQTAAKVQSDGRRNLFALANVKIKSGAAVKSRQSAAKAKDEKARKEVADNIEAMYDATKIAVEDQLSTLEKTVFSMFDNGSAAAIAEMKSNTKREIGDFKRKRYKGLRGGWRWFKDQFKATPKEIVEIIQKNLKLFKAKMDALVDRVADTVETRLKQAKNEIDKGQAKIKNYVSTLKDVRLKAIGKAAEKEVAGRFDEMREGVEERKNALAQKLAESYKSAIDKGNELASELEAENEGAAYKLAKKLAEIYQIIVDFKDKLVAILKKAVSVILDILSDPIGFFGNLVDALSEGFALFKKNFDENFRKAIAQWLFGNLGGEGFELPKDLSAPSILKLVMGVAGLTYENIRKRAATLLGTHNLALLEKLYEYLKVLFTGGLSELWSVIKKDFGNLEETVIGGIKDWLKKSLIEAGIKKLLTMFIPGGGFVQAALAIYKIVVFIVERAAQIAEFISSIVDSVADIVSGAIGAAARRIEQALIQALALIIDLLARLVGLSGIAETIKSIIKKVKDPINKAINFVIAKVVQTVKKLFGKGQGVDKNKETSESKDIKAKIGNDLSGKQVADRKQERDLLNAIYIKYKPKGLKSIKFLKKPKQDVLEAIVSASLAEKVASLTIDDATKLLTIARNLSPYAKGTTIYVFYDDGKQFGGVVKNTKKFGHAETRFKNYVLPRLLSKIKKDRKKLKTPLDEPVPVTLEINRTPCDGCSNANLVKIAKSQETADPDIKIKLIINAVAITRSNWQSHAQTSIQSVVAMKEAGIEITASTIWQVIQKKLKEFAEFEWNGKVYDRSEIETFKREAADVQELIDDATKKINAKPTTEEKKV